MSPIGSRTRSAAARELATANEMSNNEGSKVKLELTVPEDTDVRSEDNQGPGSNRGLAQEASASWYTTRRYLVLPDCRVSHHGHPSRTQPSTHAQSQTLLLFVDFAVLRVGCCAPFMVYRDAPDPLSHQL